MKKTSNTPLDAALARVVALERQIAEHGHPHAPRSSAHLYALLVIAVIAIAFSSAYHAVEPQRTVRMETPEKRPRPADGELSLAPMALFSNAGPLLVDVNMDGAKDFVVVGWHEVREDEPVYVAAIERATFKVLWRAGPFAARHRDQRLSIEVSPLTHALLVTDATGETRLDMSDGARLGRTDLEVTAAIDPFLPRPAQPCPPDKETPCTVSAAVGVEAVLGKAMGARHVFASTLTGNDTQIEVASVIMPNEDSLLYAAQLAPDASVRWAVPMLPFAVQRKVDMYPRTSPNQWTTLARGRLLSVYQLAKGPYRMLSRDVTTGALQYDVQLSDLAQGSFLEWFSADRDDAFLLADGELYVLDAKTGATTRRARYF